ncbi:MAG: hypothetical protein IJX13_01730 [Clostridia bacterium]|nr:hypothetical protein [Clostridia bacterium]
MSRNSTRQQIKALTVSAMLCALGVIILALGSFIEVIDLSVAVIASLLTVYAVIELRGAYPWLIWLVTSIVAFLLLPLKTPVLFYAMLAGYYPILKEKIEKKPLLISWALKLCVLTASLIVIYLLFIAFLPEMLAGFEAWYLLLGLYAACTVVFVLYDVCLTQLITFYLVKLQKRFRIK